MLSVVTRTLLVAAALRQTNAEHTNQHVKEPCGCAQHEINHPFTINCDDAAAIRAATVTLESTCKENKAEYEWGGSFATPDNAYKWVAEAVDGAYADASMKLVVFADDHLLDNVEAANTLMAGSCFTVNTGGSIPKPTAAGACYKLSFPADPATDFHATVNTMGVDKVAFFAEHVPTEFERDTHYLMSTDLATDIEPEEETDPDEFNCRFHTDNQVKVCAQAFYIIQAHHDYCPHDTLTRYEEELFHQWESKCYGCAIVRKYDANLKKCPVIDCTDTTVATLGYNHLNKTCTPADTEYEFEWAASFDTPADSYTWVSQAATVDSSAASGYTYADAEMKVVAFKMSSALKSELFGLKDAADTLMASTAPGSCPEATTITPTTDGACITMKFPAPATDFTAAINTAGMDNVGLFTAHMPTEFERDTHYLMDAGMTAQEMVDATAGTTVASGGPVEPVNEVGESGGHDHGGRRLSVGSLRGRRLSAVGRNDRRSHRRLANKGECCTTTTQQGAWKQVVSYHEECDHDQVPEFIEIGFHDYEASCEDHLCNLVEEGVDQTVCPSPSPPSLPSTCAADLAQCAVDKTLNAAGVLQKLKDQTIKLVFTAATVPPVPSPSPPPPVPSPSPPPPPPSHLCNYSTHDYKLVETQMTCVARGPDKSTPIWYDLEADKSTPLWYSLEAGKCSVTSANDTHVIYEIGVSSTVMFTSEPYNKVLSPSQTTQLSDMSHYADKAVILSYDIGGQIYLYAGNGSVRADGKGQIVGSRLAGVNHEAPEAPVDCVVDEVKHVENISGFGYGECTFLGDGRIEATGIGYHFSGAGDLIPASETLTDYASILQGVNAAAYAKDGTYEIFTISQINKTHMSGVTYFSNRLQAWPTDFSSSEKLVDDCSVFIAASDDCAGAGSDCSCHPAGSYLILEDGKSIAIERASVGTLVKTDTGFQPILGFLHAEEDILAQYLRFTTPSASMAISPLHHAFVNGAEIDPSFIKLGDLLHTPHGLEPVTRIETLEARGSYHFIVKGGSYFVDGILASDYDAAVSRAVWPLVHAYVGARYWLGIPVIPSGKGFFPRHDWMSIMFVRAGVPLWAQQNVLTPLIVASSILTELTNVAVEHFPAWLGTVAAATAVAKVGRKSRP